MRCPECDSEYDAPEASPIKTSDFLADYVDVGTSRALYTQLECPDCGVVFGYHGLGAAVGGSNIRGYY